MVIDNRLQVFNEEGQLVDYDILASDVKFLPDGKDLPTKLAEMEQEIGQGGYTPPQGGIPKTDLAPAVQQTLDNVANKVDKVTGKGLSSNDYTDADKAAVATIPNKANSSDLQNYATKSELTSGLSGKQNTLTFDDVPTANSNNPVKSGGIKTAIDQVTPTIDANGKWVIGGVSTNHDAHGPMGNITIEGANDMVALIVNDLTTGGQANFLSAEMGKALLSVLLQIFGNLGNYAFPNGKPTLNFNTQISFPISYSQSDQHVTYADGQGGTAPTTVDLLGRLEIQLGTNNDLYVIKESAVKVFIGGTEVSGAYDPTTDKIIIPEVYGNVVIIAEAWTYVQDGLVLHLDGKHGRTVSNRWDSLVNYNNSPLYFKLENCDESNSDYVGFDKDDNSCGIAYSDAGFQNQVTLLDVPSARGTIEFAATGMTETDSVCVMHNNIGSGNRILFAINYFTNNNTKRTVVYCSSPLSSATNGGNLYATGVKQGYFSALSNSVKVNGVDIEMDPNDGTGRGSFYSDSSGYLALLMRHIQTGTPVDVYYSANLYALRVYSEQLTDVERAQNLAIDRKRFNLGY